MTRYYRARKVGLGLAVFWLFCATAILVPGLGCSTNSVWKRQDVWKTDHIGTAQGTQLFAEHFRQSSYKQRRLSTFLISYSAGKKLEKNSWMPPLAEGYIVIKRLDDSSRLLAGLDSFFRDPIPRKIQFIKAVVRHEDHLIERSSRTYYFRLGLAFEKTVSYHDIELRTKLSDRWTGWVETGPRLTTDSIFFDNNAGKDVAYFMLGGPSGGGPSGSTELMFVESYDLSNLEPVLPEGEVPFTIEFVSAKEEIGYKHSPLARAVLTGPAVALDIVTAPIQLLIIGTFPLWGPGVLQ